MVRDLRLLEDADVRAALRGLPGWTGDARGLAREVPCRDDEHALAVAAAAWAQARAVDHHPDVDLRHGRVGLRLRTHHEGGVTDLDVALARRVSGALARVEAGEDPGPAAGVPGALVLRDGRALASLAGGLVGVLGTCAVTAARTWRRSGPTRRTRAGRSEPS